MYVLGVEALCCNMMLDAMAAERLQSVKAKSRATVADPKRYLFRYRDYCTEVLDGERNQGHLDFVPATSWWTHTVARK